MLTDALVEDGLPRHKLEAESILDHGKPAADEAGNAGKLPSDIFAGFAWPVGQAAVSRHLLADALDLLSLQDCHRAGGDMDGTVLGSREPHVHQLSRPLVEGFVDISAKPTVRDRRAVAGRQLPVEPGRAVATDLPVEAEGGERPYSEPASAPAEVVGLPTLDKAQWQVRIVRAASPDRSSNCGSRARARSPLPLAAGRSPPAPAARSRASCRAGSGARLRPRFAALPEARSRSGDPVHG